MDDINKIYESAAQLTILAEALEPLLLKELECGNISNEKMNRTAAMVYMLTDKISEHCELVKKATI